MTKNWIIYEERISVWVWEIFEARRAKDVTNTDEKSKWSHKTSNERIYGVVTRSTTKNGPRQSKNAQFRNIKAARCRMETTHRMPKTSIHRWSKTIEVTTWSTQSTNDDTYLLYFFCLVYSISFDFFFLYFNLISVTIWTILLLQAKFYCSLYASVNNVLSHQLCTHSDSCNRLYRKMTMFWMSSWTHKLQSRKKEIKSWICLVEKRKHWNAGTIIELKHNL